MDKEKIDLIPLCDKLLGHDDVIEKFLNNVYVEKLHHAWLLSGQKGIGKASFAYLVTQFLLHHVDQDFVIEEGLSIPQESQVRQLIRKNIHPDLLILQPSWDIKKEQYRSEITVNEIRRIKQFFSLKPAMGRWRICILDSIDDMNINATNAILKSLEEPPYNSIFFIINHQSSFLLDTIRSRCLNISMKPLKMEIISHLLENDMKISLSLEEQRQIAFLAHGSIGEAYRIVQIEGLNMYRHMLDILLDFPKFNHHDLHQLATDLAMKQKSISYIQFSKFLTNFLHKMIYSLATHVKPMILFDQESIIMKRMIENSSLENWMTVWHKMIQLYNDADRFNLDRKQTILESFILLRSFVK